MCSENSLNEYVNEDKSSKLVYESFNLKANFTHYWT